MIRFLLDQGLPRGTVTCLATRGIEAAHVSDLGLAQAAEEVIMSRPLAESWVVVTLDADYHQLLALRRRRGPSVVRIRDEGLHAPEIGGLLARIAAVAEPDLRAGAALTVRAGQMRIKRRPLLRRPGHRLGGWVAD